MLNSEFAGRCFLLQRWGQYRNGSVYIAKLGWVQTGQPPGGEAEMERRAFPGFRMELQDIRPVFRDSVPLVLNRSGIQDGPSPHGVRSQADGRGGRQP